MKLIAKCYECGRQHPIEFDPVAPDAQVTDWYTKHCGHQGVVIEWPERTGKKTLQRPRQSYTRINNVRLRRKEREPVRRLPDLFFGNDQRRVTPHRFMELLDNANIKIAYAATTTPTMTFASLAASSTWLAGRESGSISNASNLYLDKLTAGNYKSGAANNQAGSIYTTVVGARDDTPTWPDVFDGTDSTETVSKQGVFDAVCKPVWIIAADNTASQTWYYGPCSIAALFGGSLPVAHIYFVAHNIQTTTNVWSATESDHAIRETAVYATSA